MEFPRAAIQYNQTFVLMSSPNESPARVVAIMPARNSAATLEQTIEAIPGGCLDQIILADNASRDGTADLAARLGLTVIRQPRDRGYGGNMKTLFRAAVGAGAGYILELHPDFQYHPKYIPSLLAKARSGRYAMVMGSRFLPPRRALEGGMPWWKFASNRFLTFCNGLGTGYRLSEYHTGYRVYHGEFIRAIPFESFSDDFILAFQLISWAARLGWPVAEVPAFCEYHEKASMNPWKGSLKYGWGTLRESARLFAERRLGVRGPAGTAGAGGRA
jgi:glycosyltransferase involved in cell wall biosynthesis